MIQYVPLFFQGKFLFICLCVCVYACLFDEYV